MTNRHADAVDYILQCESNDLLTSLINAIKLRRDDLARHNRFALKVGSKVKFSHKYTEYTGTVKSIRVKKAVVSCSSPISTTYTVPLNMLEAA